MRKWTFKEDYHVCKFCETYKYLFIRDELLDELMNVLESTGFSDRSRNAVQKRARYYRSLAFGQDVHDLPKQVRELYRVHTSESYNVDHCKKLEAYIATKRQGALTSDELDLFDESAPSLAHMVHKPKGRGFTKVLEDFIEESHLRPKTKIYSDVGMKQDTFSAIRRGKYATVSRENVFRICFGLRLNYDNAIQLMKSCGMTFRAAEILDTVVEYHLQAGPSKRDGDAYKYDCELIDIDLLDSGADTLFSEW